MSARRFLRARQVAELLGVSERTVRRLIADGTLPSVRIGGARLVAEAALERLLTPATEVSEEAEGGEADSAESQAFE